MSEQTSIDTDAAGTTPTAGTDQATRRVNVVFSASAYAVLGDLAAARGASMGDVLRQAIQLEKWLADARREGWHILLEKDGRVRELVTF